MSKREHVILKPVELFSILIILADFKLNVNIADDEHCFCVRGKELICKFFSYILYIFLLLPLLRSSILLLLFLLLQLMK